jgi:hypothetical protein
MRPHDAAGKNESTTVDASVRSKCPLDFDDAEVRRNMQSDNPSIRTAARFEYERLLVGRKIAAIQFLVNVDICYDMEAGAVTKGLLSALDDVNDEVRYAVVNELATCDLKDPRATLWNERILLELSEIAQGRREFGHYREPSQKVRTAALRFLARIEREIAAPPVTDSELLEQEPTEASPVEAPPAVDTPAVDTPPVDTPPVDSR